MLIISLNVSKHSLTGANAQDVNGKGTVSEAGAVVADPFVRKDLYCWFG